MVNKAAIAASLAGLLIGITSSEVSAQMQHPEQHSPASQTGFHPIDQPPWVKAAVTLGGLGLISLELWWFLLSKPQSSQLKQRDF